MVRPRITPTKTLEILKPLLAKMSLEGVAGKPEYNRIWQSGEMTFAQLEATQDLIPDDDVFIVPHRMESPTPEHTHDFYETLAFSMVWSTTVSMARTPICPRTASAS